jgi:hypothetical protein
MSNEGMLSFYFQFKLEAMERSDFHNYSIFIIHSSL